jgi:invasion protein IalB
MRKTLCLAISGLLLSGAAAIADSKPAPAPAPQADAPETFGDWTLRCGPSPSGGLGACEVDSWIMRPGQKEPAAQIALGRPNKAPEAAAASEEGTTRLILLIPVNVTIASGVNVVADPLAPYLTIPFKSCIQAACFAEMELTAEQLRGFRNRTQPGQIIYADPSGKTVMVEFSFKGLDDALDSLAKH